MFKQQYTSADYTPLINFALSHPNLTITEVYNQAKLNGIEAQKKAGLAVLRDYVRIEKGKSRGKKVGDFIPKGEYIPPEKKPRKVKRKKSKKINFLKMDLEHEVKIKNGRNVGGDLHYIDSSTKKVQLLQKNIKELYGYSGNNFLQLEMVIANDGYTKHQRFSLLFPSHNRQQIDLSKIGYDICENLNTFYTKLAQKYSNKDSYKKIENDMLENVKEIKKSLNRTRGMTQEKLEGIFEKHGIEIVSYQTLRIVTHDDEAPEE